MPKEHKIRNALKNARVLLKNTTNACEDSDSESSSCSVDSGELSHIPIENAPSIENLSIQESNEMEQLNLQLKKMTEMMESFANKQAEHDSMFMQIQAHLNGEPSEAPSNVNTTPATEINIDALFKIPDPIKMLPTFDGNRKQLTAWLATAENTLSAFKDYVPQAQFKMYVTAVTKKIQGKAKDTLCLAGNPENFDDVKEIIINALGDRQELSTYKCQLWQCKKTDGMSIMRYYQKSKEIVQNFKTLAKQKEKYKNNWSIINDFIEEDALAAFISGLSEPYFGYAQAARPQDVEDAYAFLCKFKSKELTAKNMVRDDKENLLKAHIKRTKGHQSKFQYNKINQYRNMSTLNMSQWKLLVVV